MLKFVIAFCVIVSPVYAQQSVQLSASELALRINGEISQLAAVAEQQARVIIEQQKTIDALKAKYEPASPEATLAKTGKK
jgi:hypothetical protein